MHSILGFIDAKSTRNKVTPFNIKKPLDYNIVNHWGAETQNIENKPTLTARDNSDLSKINSHASAYVEWDKEHGEAARNEAAMQSREAKYKKSLPRKERKKLFPKG